MKHIVKKESALHVLERPIEKMARSNKMPPRIEILRTYRTVLKMTERFTWNNEEGLPWKHILRESARSEFEQLRHEDDPF